MMMHDGLECPKCGKHTIIQRDNDLFRCLNCDFVRDFSYVPEVQVPVPQPQPMVEMQLEPKPPISQPDDAWDAVGAVIIFVILALFFGL